jgi:polyferredoxin
MFGVFYHVLVRRITDWEVALFGAVYILTLIGQAPIGGAIWPGFLDIVRWIEKFPNTGGIRAWMTLMAIGTATTGIRVLLGREPRVLGAGD